MERYKEYKDSGVNMEHSKAQWFEHERTGWQRPERAESTQPRATPWEFESR